jgi:hypothetical protein
MNAEQRISPLEDAAPVEADIRWLAAQHARPQNRDNADERRLSRRGIASDHARQPGPGAGIKHPGAEGSHREARRLYAAAANRFPPGAARQLLYVTGKGV